MTSYKKLVKSKENFLSMTAYTEREFLALLPYFSKRFEAHMEIYTLEGKVRKRRGYMAYRSSPLPTIEDKLVFVLIYLKTNNLQSVQANLFEMHQPEANLWIHLLVPILKDALKDTGMAPARSMEEVDFDNEDSNLFFHDGTERAIPRPLDEDDQETYYSGKKSAIV